MPRDTRCLEKFGLLGTRRKGERAKDAPPIREIMMSGDGSKSEAGPSSHTDVRLRKVEPYWCVIVSAWCGILLTILQGMSIERTAR